MNFRLNRLLIIMIGVGVSNSIVSGQVSKEGTPYSFKHSVRSDYETVTMPEEVDVNFLLMEDKIASKDDPLRFGYPFYVEYNLENSGSWETTEDGGKIWRLGIISGGAYSINIVYDDYWDEEYRRQQASIYLKNYIDTYLSDENVIVLGDFNDDIAESPQNNVFQMILDDSENYLFVDLEIANGKISGWSYPSWPSHLDHIIITNELFDAFNNANYVQTLQLEESLNGEWNEYDQYISDHRPVGFNLVINP